MPRKHILIVAIVLLMATTGILFQISKSRTFQFFGEIIPRVNTARKAISLTFDDGPTRQHTLEILTILEARKVKATFFLIGKDLESTLDIGRQLVQAGHQLGNHSYSHTRMVLVSPEFVQSEIEATDKLIRQTGFVGEILFRPPYGKKLFALPSYLQKNHRKTITWDIEPETNPAVAGNASAIVEDVLRQVEPGSIILLHGMYESGHPTIEALPRLIEGLQRRGFEFLTVSQLLAMT